MFSKITEEFRALGIFEFKLWFKNYLNKIGGIPLRWGKVVNRV